MSDELASQLQADAGASDTWADRDLLIAATEAGTINRPAPARPPGLDSDEETDFHDAILGSMVGPHVRGWVLRQVSLGSLTGDALDSATLQRVDFAVFHPRGLQFIVEIDGQQHSTQEAEDDARDKKITAAGFIVARVPAEEVRQREGPALRALVQRLLEIPVAPVERIGLFAKWLLKCKRAHQVQVAILEWLAANRGMHSTGSSVGVSVQFDAATRAVVGDTNAFLQNTLADLSALVMDVADARGEQSTAATFRVAEDGEIRLSFDAATESPDPGVGYLADAYAPVPLSANLPRGGGTLPTGVGREGCERVLKRLYGFDRFREGQFEAVSRAMLGQDSILLLPTGSGKSVAFQLSALLRSGVCIVVDPILSLIDDQIENLLSAGIDRVIQITGNLTPQQREIFLEFMKRGEYLFCYIAPERFQDEAFRASLLTMTSHTSVALVAIDEAHCVSEWGHDFRPAYLNLARNAREYCRSALGCPPIMALTGTASHTVLKDVQRELGIANFEAIITPRTFDRPELTFQVQLCRSPDKPNRLHGLLLGLPDFFGQESSRFFEPAGDNTMAGLIFCPHANGDHGITDVASSVTARLQRPVPFYAGEPPRGFDKATWPEQKRRTASGFKRNEFPLMVCTKAFGMGIDKPNVRYTIHYNLPASIESFYQEAGRAGRDRHPARCIVMYSNDDEARSRRLLDPNTPITEVRAIVDATKRPASDDITRMLYFHLNAFRGVEQELASIDEALDALGDLTAARRVVVPFGPDGKLERERAIHRLLVIGVLRDYTVNYPKKEFVATIAGASQPQILDHFSKYIAAYQRQRASAAVNTVRGWGPLSARDFVQGLAAEVIAFVYDVVERGRRRNLSEMLRLLETSEGGEQLRQGVLQYLEQSQFSQAIDELPMLDDAGLYGAVAIVDRIRSAFDAGEVRGESARALGAYPDYPGLLLLRAIAEALSSRPDEEALSENARAAAQLSSAKYDLPQTTVCDAALQSALILNEERPGFARALLHAVLEGVPDRRGAARWMLEQRPAGLQDAAAAALLTEVRVGIEAATRR